MQNAESRAGCIRYQQWFNISKLGSNTDLMCTLTIVFVKKVYTDDTSRGTDKRCTCVQQPENWRISSTTKTVYCLTRFTVSNGKTDSWRYSTKQ